MANRNNHDMGTGSVKKLMVQMAVPALVGQVINLLYNVVDRIYIGHIPGADALAMTGVGLTLPVITILAAFAILAELRLLLVLAEYLLQLLACEYRR